jgi:transcriptional regulator of arginine metabolism
VSTVEARRRAILELIAELRIETQEQLVGALADAGIEASQASVSRDIAALELVKAGGRWTAPAAERSAVDPNVERIAGRLLSVAPAGDNLLVLKTPAGEAQGVALGIDGLAPDGVVGTVAGDDTIFVAVTGSTAGDALARQLSAWVVGGDQFAS